MHVHHFTCGRKIINKYKNKIITNVNMVWFHWPFKKKEGRIITPGSKRAIDCVDLKNYPHIRSCDNSEQYLLLQGFGFVSCM
jgi:hypothetical protein